MTSLSEVYEGGTVGADLRRLYLGVGLFVVGALLAVTGIVVAAAPGLSSLFGGTYAAREVAGVLGGVGVPLVFLGIVTILPQASWRLRAVAVAGAVVSVAAVVAFVQVYPHDWTKGTPAYAFPVVALYSVGGLASFWCVFTAVANFKTRNDPGGTVRLEVTKEGETRVVEVSNERLRQSLGGIGVLGGTPDGEAETQTNRPDRGGDRRATTDGGASATTSTATRSSASGTRVDAGVDSVSTTPSRGSSGSGSPGTSPGSDAEVVGGGEPKGDTYCGNCDHFKYVRTEDGMQPYCGYHREVMDDMDPCEAWTPNESR